VGVPLRLGRADVAEPALAVDVDAALLLLVLILLISFGRNLQTTIKKGQIYIDAQMLYIIAVNCQ
jgi:hypothetical protein